VQIEPPYLYLRPDPLMRSDSSATGLPILRLKSLQHPANEGTFAKATST
jgi:hypothetical protein